jgi:hypothetical protein
MILPLYSLRDVFQHPIVDVGKDRAQASKGAEAFVGFHLVVLEVIAVKFYFQHANAVNFDHHVLL